MYTSKIPVAEALLTGVSIWWAIVLIMNRTVLDSTLPTYMEKMTGTNETLWAGVFAIAATTKVVGLLIYSVPLRKAGLIMSMCLYSLICTGYFLNNAVFSTGTGVYFLFTVLAWFGWREVKENDD